MAYPKLAKFLSLIALMLVIAPFLYAFIAPGTTTLYAVLFSFAAPCLLLFGGYSIQAIMGKLTKFKRTDDSFDPNEKYVDMPCALLPLILCAASYIPFSSLYERYKTITEGIFDRYALDLYLVPALFALAVAAGVILWFYPYHKILHIELVFAYGAVYLATLIISVINGAGLAFLIICFIIFLALFFTVSNLRSIEQSLSASKFRVPDNNFRSYNFSLTVKHYFITLLCALLLFSVLFLCGRAFGALINSGSAEDEPKEKQEQSYYENSPAKGGYDRDIGFESYNDDAGLNPLTVISSIVVVAAFIILVLYLLFKKRLLLRFFAFISLIFSSIAEFLSSFLLLLDRSKPDLDSFPSNYVDTESRVDYYAEYREYGIFEELTFKGFESRLEEKEGLTEKYAYAYSVYTSLIQGDKYGIKASDTPRMLTAKLTAQRLPQLEIATPIYEDIRYALKPPANEGVCRQQLAELVKLIKEILK